MVSCKEICNRIPVGTLVGATLIILGNLICLIHAYFDISSSKYYQENFNSKAGNNLSTYLFALIWLLTIILAIVLVLIAFAGSVDDDSNWSTKLKGSRPCLIMLILTFFFLIPWMWMSYASVSMGEDANISKNSCSDYDYYKDKDHYGPLCINIPFEKDIKIRQLCVPKRIDSFCNNVVPQLTATAGFLAMGSQLTTWGLIICLICLGLNLSLSRVESSVDLNTIGKRRY